MNIETANKLVELRKKNNLSQEDLANKLGISRQAVSKWERAEAAPDTDNLVKLARLYKISLDDLLLSGDSSEEDEVFSNDEYSLDEDGIKITKGDKEIFIRSKSGVKLEESLQTNSKMIIKKRTLYTIITTLCTIGFFLFGFLTAKWEIAWIFFLGIPLLNSIVIAIYTRKLRYFNYTIFVTIVFFILGFVAELWIYTWILFLTIPIFYALVGGVKGSIQIK